MIKNLIITVAGFYMAFALVVAPDEPFGPGYTWSLIIRKMQEAVGSYSTAFIFFIIGLITLVKAITLFKKNKQSGSIRE